MKIRVRIITLILAVFVALFAAGTAFAWFSSKRYDMPLKGSSAGAYFAYGDGTEDQSEDKTTGPYGITDPIHLFNLAWLQNTGKIKAGTYFELGKSITMAQGYVLPPIGNVDHPFNSTFNGNGHTISNLVVSTNKQVLRDKPAGDLYEFSNAVGMFGLTGAASGEENQSNITNFILDNPTVEVASTNTKYSTAAADGKYVGLAIGYVANKASSIGVIGGTLAVRKTDYKTVNSILGNLSEDAMNNQNVTGGGALGSGGSGSAFGASFDVDSLVKRLEKILDNKQSSTPSWRLPNIDTQNNKPVPAGGDKIPFSIIPESDDGSGSTYTGADARELISDNNVGYFIGNQNKIDYTKEIAFGEPLIDPKEPSTNWYTVDKDGKHLDPNESNTTPAWIYKIDTGYGISSHVYTSQMGFAPLSEEEFAALPASIQAIVPTQEELDQAVKDKTKVKKKFLKIALSTSLWLSDSTISPTFSEQLNDWSFHGQVNWMGKTYGKGFRDSNGDTLDENGENITAPNQHNPALMDNVKFYQYDEGIFLPNNAVWFKPAHAGTAKFLMFNSDESLKGFVLLRVKRNSANPNEPFKAKVERNESWEYSNDVEISEVFRVSVPRNVLFYFSHEISQEEIKDGNIEYYLIGDRGAGADFIYLDIGSSAADTESDTDHADPEKTITAIDFIYKGVTITQNEVTGEKNIPFGSFIVSAGDAVTLYAETGTMLSFGGNGAIVTFYYRDDGGTFHAAYNSEDDSNSLTPSVSNKASITQTTNDVNITADFKNTPWVPTA